MADIKSSLEIALERAAAMGGSDKDDVARDEGRQQGKTLARKMLAGELAPDEMGAEINALSGAGRDAAREAAAGLLCSALPQAGGPVVAALRAMGAPAQALARLEEALAGVDQGLRGLMGELGQAQAELLAQHGLSGPAVMPNPWAHPQAQELHDQRLGPVLERVSGAARELQAEMAS